MLTAGELDAVVVLPAASATCLLDVSALPSPVIVLFAGHVLAGTPDKVSLHVHWIVTSPLYQPFALGDVVGAPLNVGGCVSMLMFEMVAVVEVLPALSVACPLAD
jgi:hypothetical protein